ncbi:MAG TPA: metallophosphoesterase [Actinomycetales bacterium]|nr:metallophosphoesterase [Actinomycetales bacterium]
MDLLRPLLRPLTRHDAWRILVVSALALLGAGAGAALAPATHADVGPLAVQVKVRPSLHPGVVVRLPPAGSVRFDTHQSPIAVQALIESVDLDEARRVVARPDALQQLQEQAPDDIKGAVVRSLGWTFGCALLGSGLLVGIAARGWRGIAAGMSVTMGVGAVLAGATALSFDGEQLAEPQFTGLLSSAPYVQQRTENLAEQLENYRSGLSDFVQSVTTLYALGDRLPGFDPDTGAGVTTVLHISDLHLNPLGYDLTQRLVTQFKVDAIVDSGDLSTWGSEVEQGFVTRIGTFGVPYVFVRGNHDSEGIAEAVAKQKNAVVLDDDVRTIDGLTIAGIADPRNTPAEGEGDTIGKDAVAASVAKLADRIRRYDLVHREQPVQIAVVHDPTRLDAILGSVPLVLSGHLHKRSVREEKGTRVMVEGSTGGAGLTSAGFERLTEGKPVPLEATLLYFAKSGDRAGQLVAYDDVTVGGLGLTSVSIDRTTVKPPKQGQPGSNPPTPGPSPGTPPVATPGTPPATQPRSSSTAPSATAATAAG